MISIIICSRDLHLYDKVEKSIKKTIGSITYEIIKIDNSIDNISITKAYNLGIDKSKYEHLLFVHEDILFHTNNWGDILINIFKKNSNIGLIGIAGAKYKSKYPSAFWHTETSMIKLNLIQHYNCKKSSLHTIGFENDDFEDVVVLDGVFMALNKKLNVRFNEEILGFHCYDSAICIDVLEIKRKIIVTNEILIEHFSIGNTDLKFVNSLIKFHELYKRKLPKYLTSSSKINDVIALKKFLEICLQNRFIPYNFWIKYMIFNLFDKLNYNLLKLLIHKKLKKN
ncbi:glycosyltransferase [Flavobacterium sp. K5-23]|uniref:glycosyltransferase n=1 Tax=Flavobacterium sp. K5-23 TaxID=2746225 RepID=UPI00200BC6C0|nr:glycosyltransferase [Flavobacterium sp. K5-23]UQD56151.1 hypothetical protein FLAK523_07000 [Flavobacterium sp. K5-23]